MTYSAWRWGHAGAMDAERYHHTTWGGSMAAKHIHRFILAHRHLLGVAQKQHQPLRLIP